MIRPNNKPIPVHYHDTIGWIADVEESISISALQAIAEFTYKINYDRWLGMGPGYQKDRVGIALSELKKGKIQQRLIGKINKEVPLFTAHEGTGKIISIGGK